jgi:hypothetical protein
VRRVTVLRILFGVKALEAAEAQFPSAPAVPEKA